MDHQKVLRTFYPLLIHGDDISISRAFGGEPLLDTPKAGRIEGRDSLRLFVVTESRWLREHKATVVRGGLLHASDRVVEQQILVLRRGPTIEDLPVALVADIGMNGLTALRLYHGSWPLAGGPAERPPLVPAVDTIELPEAIARSLEFLAAGDVGGLLDLFEEGATIQEPRGGPHRHQGRTAIRRYLDGVLKGGGMSLRPCTVTTEGTRCAVEYVCERYGGKPTAPQGGFAVYDLTPDGTISALTIYDDIGGSEDFG